MSNSTTTTRPALSNEDRAQFDAFGVTVVYPVTVTRDIKTRAGNVLARKGEKTWGGLDAIEAHGTVMILTPHHYAGCKSSSVNHSIDVDLDNGVTL
jgi:hypothetical protein